MAIKGGRLPKRYVFAHSDDTAIDWFGSAEQLKVDVADFADIEDEKQRREQVESMARKLYLDLGAVRGIPLKAKTGDKITLFICQPLTQDEVADLYGYVVNPMKMALEAVRLALVEVKNFGEDKYEGVEDLPSEAILSVGARIFGANHTSGEEKDFS